MEEKRTVMSIISKFRSYWRSFFPIRDIQSALGIRAAVSQEMIEISELWYDCYVGNAPWLGEDIDHNIVTSLGLEKSVVRELADIVTNEMTVDVDKDELKEALDYVLSELPSEFQKGLATGAMVIKPTGSGRGVQFIPQSEFLPVEYDSEKRLKSVVFPEVRKIGEYWYTRLEYHKLSKRADGTGELRITNTAYRSGQQGVLGVQIDLKAVEDWAQIEPEISYPTDRPVFGYYRNPLPNVIDSSPAGVSVFDNALNTISLADRQFSRIDYEFDSARRRIIADEQGVKKLSDGRTVMGANIFTPLDIEELFKEFSPEIRKDFIDGLNEYKREIEFQCGLSYGDISDPQSVDKTATEIIAAKQRKYNTVTAIQKRLKTCIEELVYAIAFWKAMTGSNYSVTVNFKDSILTDEEAERRQDIQDINLGVMSLVEYRMKWYGEDEETAKKNIPESAEVIE